jgi:4,5-DOPA dioxygenase extradiol
MTMPVIFAPHGAPTFALAPGEAGLALSRLASRLEQPACVVVVSAHWDTDIPSLGASDHHPETIHDFRGFPKELDALSYPAPGAPEVAMAAAELLKRAGFEARPDARRGLDHGAWVPLRFMFPDASVPVVPLSIQSHLGPEHHFRMGRALRSLSDQGILIVASGNLTHNLSHYRQAALGAGATPAYVDSFRDWAWDKLERRELGELLAYRDHAPGAQEAHPEDDHLLPLFVALGAAQDDYAAERLFSGVYDFVIAMDGFVLWPSPRD